MLPGQTLVAPDGYQVALFPLEVLRVTQGYGRNTYSHCCGAPMDFGKTIQYTPLYAPFDMHLTFLVNGGSNGRMYASDNLVWTPSGLMYMTIYVVHDNNPPTQTTFRQGELFAHTGTASGTGSLTAEHTHIETATGVQNRKVKSNVKCRNKTYYCDYVPDFQPPNKMLYVNDTTITNNGGYTWYEYQGGQPGPGPSPTPIHGRKITMVKKWLSISGFNGRIKL